MKKFVSKSERIKEFVEYIESNGHRVEDLFDFVDSHNVEKGIHFKGTLVRKGKKVVYIYRNTIVSYEMAKTLCDILSTLIWSKFSGRSKFQFAVHKIQLQKSTK